MLRTLLLTLLTLSACSFTPPKPPMSQLEVREMQTRAYEKKKISFTQVMKAVINVLQDDGFIIKNADRELGFITAEKEDDVSSGWEAALGFTLNGQQTRYNKNAVTACSVNITEIGPQVRVRSIFQRKVMDNFGAVASVRQIDNPVFYRDFFSRVDKGLFLEGQGL